MKRLLVMLMLVGITSTASAKSLDISEKIKDIPLKQGIAFSLVENKVNYLSTLELMNWKGLTLEAGYAGSEEPGHKLVGVISYPILKLDKYIDTPILDLLELNLGIWGGIADVSLIGDFYEHNETDWGISATLMSFKF